MLAEELSIGLNRRLLVATHIGLVVVEVHVFYVLAEQVFIRHIRSRRWRWRSLSHGQPRGGFLTPSRTFRDQVICRRISRRDALRPIGLDCANSVNRYVRGVAGLPCQRCGLSRLNGIRIHGDRSRGGWRCGRGGWWRWSCLLSACAEHEKSTKCKYQREPLETKLLHVFIPP